MKGNEAIAEAAITAGCKLFFGYPITPQTEISAYMAKRMPKVGGTFLQAESEISAINMVYGASGAGARAMTSSSSPGISLKSEGLSYLAGCDLPCVVVNIVRAGPGLGGILPSQGDYFQATRGGGHGDYRMIVLAPAGVQEAFDCTRKAFDLADKYRVTVMIMGDGMLGQMMEPVDSNEFSEIEELPVKEWATTGTGCKRRKNIIYSLETDPQKLEKMILDRQARYDIIYENEQLAETYQTDDADLVLVAYGTSARVAKATAAILRKEGFKAGVVRPITLWPFPEKILSEIAKNVKAFMAVEMSQGQMVEDVRLVSGGKPVYFYGRNGGIVPNPKEIALKAKEVMSW